MPPSRNEKKTQRSARRYDPLRSTRVGAAERLARSTLEAPRQTIPYVGSDVHVSTFVRNFDAGVLVGSTAADTLGALKFVLTQLPSYTEFTTLFDQYRIARMEYTFLPYFTIGTPSAYAPFIATAVDYDDGTAPASFAAIQQYENSRVISAYNKFSVSYQPHIAIAAYSGAFTSYANNRAGWIDSASTAVEHYGVKWVIGQCSGSAQSFRVVGRVIIQTKNVR
jgi:hypothetical protein